MNQTEIEHLQQDLSWKRDPVYIPEPERGMEIIHLDHARSGEDIASVVIIGCGVNIGRTAGIMAYLGNTCISCKEIGLDEAVLSSQRDTGKHSIPDMIERDNFQEFINRFAPITMSYEPLTATSYFIEDKPNYITGKKVPRKRK